MSDDDTYKLSSDSKGKNVSNKDSSEQPTNSQMPQIVIQNEKPRSTWWSRIIFYLLIFSIFLNISLISSHPNFMQNAKGPKEKYKSGDVGAKNKIAVLTISGTIMPPLTERTLKTIKRISEDDNIKGVMLVVDSPGGLVADSHQIYHRLKALSEKKTVYVSMKRLAASGGYYVAMGAGPEATIFVEPTTWTGSIGVILPRYDLSGLAKEWGIKSDPITTGEFKNTLDPLTPMNDDERKLWENILAQSYDKFVTIIDENRTGLNKKQVTDLADGRIYTADDAIKNGLVDEIAFTDEAIIALKDKLGLDKYQVVEYEFAPTLSDLLMGYSSAQNKDSNQIISTLLETAVPRPMYYFAWQGSMSRAK